MNIPVSDRLPVGVENDKPLVVDLDGTLVRSDLLIETAFSALGSHPQVLFAMLRSKAALKHSLAQSGAIDVGSLPYDQSILDRVRTARSQGRPVYLASASNQRLVQAIAEHLAVFDGWFGSDEAINLTGTNKALKLVSTFGERGFDYIGNDAVDLAIWTHAATAITIRASELVKRRLAAVHGNVEHIDFRGATWKDWLQLARVHQYAKNLLIFVPILTAHTYSLTKIIHVIAAFFAFSLCASSVYILNDLADISADRNHPRKRNRPLASGAIPLKHALVAIPVLFASALLLAGRVSLTFVAVLIGYACLTSAYSFYLKRKMIIDAVTLAMLYCARILAGGVAADVPISEWLVVFSMFIFMSLALVKRYIELTTRLDAGMPEMTNRNYRTSDLEIVGALAAASGFNAITVFALYVSSNTVHDLYRRPQLLWLICPVLTYWICRVLMMAHRRWMEDDPIVFAFKDWHSLVAGVIVVILVLAAA